MSSAPMVDSLGDRGGLRGALWRWLGAAVFRRTFHNWYRARNAILRAFGATIDPTVRIRETARIDRPWNLTVGRKSSIGEGARVYAPAPVVIGERAVCSQFVALCAFRERWEGGAMRLEAAPIRVGDDAWIAAEAVVGGVDVAPGVVLGARSSVGPGAVEVAAWTIAAGIPARSVAPRSFRE